MTGDFRCIQTAKRGGGATLAPFIFWSRILQKAEVPSASRVLKFGKFPNAIVDDFESGDMSRWSASVPETSRDSDSRVRNDSVPPKDASGRRGAEPVDRGLRTPELRILPLTRATSWVINPQFAARNLRREGGREMATPEVVTAVTRH